MSERARAVTLATWVLDDASRDPDSDMSILARQFLRAIDLRARPSLEARALSRLVAACMVKNIVCSFERPQDREDFEDALDAARGVLMAGEWSDEDQIKAEREREERGLA